MQRNEIPRLADSVIVVHTRDDKTVRGLLLRVGKDVLVLAHASILDGDRTIPLSGEVFVERANVSLTQRPTLADALPALPAPTDPVKV